jgi:hypothetical protein
MTWQPIDTAPKDGTWILVWGGKTDEVGEWDKHEEVFMNRPVVAHWRPPKVWQTEEGYWQFANYDSGYYGDFSKDHEPTHWQPLPPLPEDHQ